jgi:2-amino-4-hydroxy-6-hydroxymethyldihydropteridine diphosphokinase
MTSPPSSNAAVAIEAWLSLGGNMGDRKALMDAAVERIAALPGTRITARSPYFRTAPDGPVEQEWFVNLAIAVATGMDADALAAACRAIEADLGRDRSKEVPWGPRPIDIDVIAIGRDGVMEPYGGAMDMRGFVQIPLSHIVSTPVTPGVAPDRNAVAPGQNGVVILDWPVPPLP